MEDITAEKELQRQLLEAENIRENEMRSLFQIIQIDPRVLNDFVVDAEYEFERINEMLKDKKQVQQEVLVEMYQSVHAVKSNALILNLEGFSDRLHKLESSVKALQEEHKDIVPFDDFLSLILEFDDAMKEMDKLKETIAKIQSFRDGAGTDKNQERYVLVETLTRVCNKTQAALDKKVRFVVDGIDEVVLDYGPRRVIKEVLTQLVRNAVYHGIERPDERTPLGKEPEGEIRLSIKYKDNQIVMKLADNGGGIDFSRIKQKAEENNMVHNEEEANDKNYLLKTLFVPGFSTLGQADYHAGRGMGLSLVKDRVKDLNGNITVTTAKGKGTTFTITIPLELHARVADTAS
jgi:two-component system chemotaxis sensor kinase CheA